MQPHISETSFLDHTVLQFAGELDLVARPLFISARRVATSVAGPRLILDLSRVQLLDCSAVREITTIVECVSPGAVTVCPDGAVLRMLRMTGFTRNNPVVPTLLDATLPRREDLLSP